MKTTKLQLEQIVQQRKTTRSRWPKYDTQIKWKIIKRLKEVKNCQFTEKIEKKIYK